MDQLPVSGFPRLGMAGMWTARRDSVNGSCPIISGRLKVTSALGTLASALPGRPIAVEKNDTYGWMSCLRE
ncbi:hypothetical protein J6590_029849 [Homalodisca vitripennis]|nr:hypothetical protein J6590_029849 [Homalodisca vitripennis]